MSVDALLERFVSAHERIANALESMAAGSGDAEKPARGRPRKVATVPDVPPEQGKPDAGEANATAAAPAVATPAAAPAVSAAAASTGSSVHPLEELQKLVGYVCSKGKTVEVKGIFTKYGTERASGIPADKRDAAFAEIVALVPPAVAA